MKLEDIKIGGIYKKTVGGNVLVGVCRHVNKPTGVLCGVCLEADKEGTKCGAFLWSYDGSDLEPATEEERERYLELIGSKDAKSYKATHRKKQPVEDYEQLTLF